MHTDYLQQTKSAAHMIFCVLRFHAALNFLLGLNACQHFSSATCFLHDIKQVVLPPESLGLQPRENFTL